jgi:HK97 gp10 family phage protein
MARKVRLQGARELDRALRELAQPAQRRVVRSTMQAVARIVQRAVRNGAPRGRGDPHPKYGRLRDNIRIALVPGAQRLRAVVHTGRAFWSKWVEYGRSALGVKRKKVLSDGKTFFGREVKAMPARPFFRPAWDTTSARLLPEIARRIGAGLEREAARLMRGRRR